MQAAAIGPFVIAALAFYVGAYHLSVWARARTRTVDRAFALHCFAACAYIGASSAMFVASTPSEAIVPLRFLDSWGLIVGVTFPLFVHAYTRTVDPRVVYAAGGLMMLAIVIVGCGPMRWVIRGPLELRDVTMGPIHARFFESAPGVGTRAIQILGVANALLAMLMVARHVRTGDPRAKPLAVACTIALLTVVHDLAVESELFPGLYTVSYGYMAMIVVMAFSLSREVLRAAEIEAALRASERRTREAQKLESLGKLAGGIAHDFNNMLAGVVAYADLIQRDASISARSRFAAERIAEAGTRAAELTARLLAFARRTPGVATAVDVHRAIDDALALLERTVDPRIVVVRALTATNAIVRGDASQIESAVLNLGVNARDAMPEGGRLIVTTHNVELDASHQRLGIRGDTSELVVIAVEDGGVGIEESVRQHIFEPFFTTKPNGEGTGLGLAAVAATIEEMGGGIHVDSQVGVGTRVELFLPVAEPGAVIDLPRASIVDRRFEGTALIIDDQALVRDALRASLESLGFLVLSASDGESGVEILRRERDTIRLVVMDLVMPKWSAEQTFVALREAKPGIPLVLVSGFRGEARVAELVAAGDACFLPKPFRMRDLAEAVEKILGQPDGRAGDQSSNK